MNLYFSSWKAARLLDVKLLELEQLIRDGDLKPLRTDLGRLFFEPEVRILARNRKASRPRRHLEAAG